MQPRAALPKLIVASFLILSSVPVWSHGPGHEIVPTTINNYLTEDQIRERKVQEFDLRIKKLEARLDADGISDQKRAKLEAKRARLEAEKLKLLEGI